mmetsp:Transcript_17655/g.35507  ORF Transcript_17655/g.35507 Transcript_17655/m.35507 type:complete len:517 (+) Transcript_17655:81-1631(+)
MPLFSFLQNNPAKKEYDITNQTLGKGKFAVVKLATHKATGKQVAVKIINKENCKREDQLAKLDSEIAIMKKVHHPNCIEFYEMFDASNKLYIVMELVTGGELFDRIIAKEHYSETEAAGCFIQVMSAIEYLHSIGIVHRDIKPENVLYQSQAEDSPIKLADFGLGKLLDLHGSDSKQAMMTVCGTPSYLAPEVIQHKGYGMECDVWSAGVILYILLCGAPPFDQTAPMPMLFKAIINQRYSFPDPMWTEISDDAKDIIRRMMVVDVAKRLTPRGVLEHPWLKRYQKSDLPTVQMTGMQQRLKDWNAARRLKGAISTFAALIRMSSEVLTEMPSAAQQEDILSKVRSDEARLQVLREAFDMLDRDHSGVIDLQNIADSLKALNFIKSPVELKAMLQRFDVRKTGTIDFDEFCIMMGPAYYMRKASSQEEELAHIFDAFDLQRTGTINPSELKEILSRLGQSLTDDELDDMVRQADANSDGVIDFNEFRSFLLNHIKPTDSGTLEVTAAAQPRHADDD